MSVASISGDLSESQGEGALMLPFQSRGENAGWLPP